MTMEALAGIPSRQLFHTAQQQNIDDYAALTVSNIAACSRELAWVTVVSDGLSGKDVNILRITTNPKVYKQH